MVAVDCDGGVKVMHMASLTDEAAYMSMERKGKDLQTSAKATVAPSEGSSTISVTSFPTSSSDGSSGFWQCATEAKLLDESRVAHRIRPYVRFAHCADDVLLLVQFVDLACVPDVSGSTVKLLLRALRHLRLCSYSTEDICCILAHASVYFIDAFASCGKDMDPVEVGNILVILIFIAHSYVQDETCPLHVWHQHLFRKYCNVKTLNAAVLRLLEIRNYVLRLEPDVLQMRYKALLRNTKTSRMASMQGESIEN